MCVSATVLAHLIRGSLPLRLMRFQYLPTPTLPPLPREPLAASSSGQTVSLWQVTPSPVARFLWGLASPSVACLVALQLRAPAVHPLASPFKPATPLVWCKLPPRPSPSPCLKQHPLPALQLRQLLMLAALIPLPSWQVEPQEHSTGLPAVCFL